MRSVFPARVCPHCETEIRNHYEFLKNKRTCPHCGKQVGVTLKLKGEPV